MTSTRFDAILLRRTDLFTQILLIPNTTSALHSPLTKSPLSSSFNCFLFTVNPSSIFSTAAHPKTFRVVSKHIKIFSNLSIHEKLFHLKLLPYYLDYQKILLLSLKIQ